MAKVGAGLRKAAKNRTPEQDRALIAEADRRLEENVAFHESFRRARTPTLHVYGAAIVRY